MVQTIQVASKDDVFHLTPAGFERFARYIRSELGIKMPETKTSMVQSRLVRRVRELGLHSVEEYGEYLFTEGHIEERDHFFDAITTNKTDFFREPEHFAFLTTEVMPALAASTKTNQINLWSAACSSGEEPYTLAMVLSEYCKQQSKARFSILATDVSTRVLTRARQAIYSFDSARVIPLDIRRQYFLESRDQSVHRLRIVPELRGKVSFHRLNLMDEDYRVKNRFDVIFLRNVLIYFDKQIQETVVNRLCSYLNTGGYLFVGHSESLSDLRVPVTRVNTSVYRLPL